MGQHHKPTIFILRSLLGSALLTFVFLTHHITLAQNVQDSSTNPANIANNPPRAHSPYANPGNPPLQQLQTESNSMAKRSLFPHLFDKANAKASFFQHSINTKESADTIRQDQEEQEQEQEQEQQTIIEPNFSSIDLFDEVVDELLELGEDGILRVIDNSINRSRHRSYPFDSEPAEGDERYDQIWMVDEWEEEFDVDMDELMDWAEEDGILNSRFQRMEQEERNHLALADIVGSHRLRDQGSIQNALLNEDEASPFQRLFSESWLF